MSLRGKTAFITGASRGIGLEIGKALAARGANIAVAAKTADPNPRLPGTIHSAVEEIDKAGESSGARGLAIQLDIRQADAVQDAIEKTASRFGGIDIVVNNASAINMKPTIEATPKSFDLMTSINARGTWLVSRYALPHLLRSAEQSRNPHILTLSPPLDIFSTEDKSFPSIFAQTASAYAVAKIGMSLATFALAAELHGKVACNGLWPYTLIGTSAMKLVGQSGTEHTWRDPRFVAEAARRILEGDTTGQFHIDETYLRRTHNWTDEQVDKYSMGAKIDDLAEDLYITEKIREDVRRARRR